MYRYFNRICVFFLLIFLTSSSYSFYLKSSTIKENEPIDVNKLENLSKNDQFKILLDGAWSYFLFNSDREKASILLEQAKLINPNDFKVNELSAILAECAGDINQELDYYLKLIKSNNLESEIFIKKLMGYTKAAKHLDIQITNENQRNKLKSTLIDVISKPSTNFNKHYCQLLLADLYREEGNYNSAIKLMNNLGIITQWQVLGPFDNDRGSGFHNEFPPEKEIDLTKEYKGRRANIKWKEYVYYNSEYSVEMSNIYYPSSWVTAYALTYCFAEEDTQVYLCFGNTDQVKLWLNDKQLMIDETKKEFRYDQFILKIQINKGWNKLLFKLCNENNSQNLLVRMLDLKGNPVKIKFTVKDDEKLLNNLSQMNEEVFNNPNQNYFDINEIIQTIDKIKQKSVLIEDINNNYIKGIFQDYIKNHKEEMIKDENVISKLIKNTPKNDFSDTPSLQLYLKGKFETEASASLEALYYNANIYSLNDLKEKSLQVFEKYLSENDKCAYIYSLMYNVFIRNNKEPNANSSIKNAIEKDPDCSLYSYLLGSFYKKKNLFDKSINEYRKSLDSSPSNVNSLLAIGQSYSKKKYNYDSLKTIIKGVIASPYNSIVYNYFGKIQDKLQKNIYSVKAYLAAYLLNHESLKLVNKVAKFFCKVDDYKSAMKMYYIYLIKHPYNIQVRKELAQLYLRYNLFDEAKKTCLEALKICPENSEFHHLMGDSLYKQGNIKLAIESYNQALFYNPKNTVLRDYVDFLVPPDDTFFKKYETSDETIEKIIKGPFDRDKYPDAQAVCLFKEELIQVFEDGSSNNSVREIVKILSKEALKEYSYKKMPSNAKVKKARTITPDGSEKEVTKIVDNKLAFPELSESSIIDYSYTYQKSQGGWLKEHYYNRIEFQKTDPAILSNVILSVPKAKVFKVFKTGKIDETIAEENEKVVYKWVATNISQIYKESYSLPASELMTSVLVSTIPEWQDLARWHVSLINDQFEIDNSIRDKVKELTANKSTVKDKIRSIYNFVTNEIRYLQMDSGIFGKKPNKSVDIFANRFGDCKEKSTLLICMLKEIGVKAYYAALMTNNQGKMHTEVPSPQTNHVITYIPKQENIDEAFFVDPTTENYSFDYLRPNDQGVITIVLKENGEWEFINTPVLEPSKNSLTQEFISKVEENGNVKVKANIKAQGNHARDIRNTYRIEGKQKENLSKNLNFAYSGAEIQEFKFSDLKNMDQEIELNVDFNVPNYGIVKDNSITIKMFETLDLNKKYTANNIRHHPFQFKYTEFKPFSLSIALPKGYKVESIPKDLEIDNEYIFYSIKYSNNQKDNSVIIKRQFTVKKLDYLDDYNKLRDTFIQIDNQEAIPVIIKK